MTTCRIGSLLPIHRDEVQWRPGAKGKEPWLVIPADRMKADLPHSVPLTEAMLEWMGDPGSKGYYLISPHRRGGPITSYSSAMRRHKEATGNPHLGPHVLRTTTATRLGALGVPGHVISEILGHAPQDVTGRHYQLHRYDRERRSALELWSRTVKEPVSDASTPNGVVPSLLAEGSPLPRDSSQPWPRLAGAVS